MVTQKSLSITLVTFNSLQFIGKSIASIIKQTIRDYQLLIIDNNSQDGTVDYVRKNFPWIPLIVNKTNLGFCKAHNMGIRESRAAYHSVINPDVVLESDYFETLIQAIDNDSTVGMATGKLYLVSLTGKPACIEKKIIDSTGIIIHRNRRSLDRGQGETDQGKYTKKEYVFGVSGAASVYRRAMLEELKIDSQYFDEKFFVYREDTDLSWRAQIYGWRALYVPKAIGYHQRRNMPGRRGEMSPEINLHSVKNRIIMILKNENLPGLLRDGIFYIPYEIAIFFYILFFEWRSLPAYLNIKRKFREILRWRKIIQANKKVSAGEINKWLKGLD